MTSLKDMENKVEIVGKIVILEDDYLGVSAWIKVQNDLFIVVEISKDTLKEYGKSIEVGERLRICGGFYGNYLKGTSISKVVALSIHEPDSNEDSARFFVRGELTYSKGNFASILTTVKYPDGSEKYSRIGVIKNGNDIQQIKLGSCIEASGELKNKSGGCVFVARELKIIDSYQKNTA